MELFDHLSHGLHLAFEHRSALQKPINVMRVAAADAMDSVARHDSTGLGILRLRIGAIQLLDDLHTGGPFLLGLKGPAMERLAEGMSRDGNAATLLHDADHLSVVKAPIGDIDMAQAFIGHAIEQNVTEIAIDLNPLKDPDPILQSEPVVVDRAVDDAMFGEDKAI